MNTDDPPLKCLTAFDATVRLESMTAAARELATSQPAISQRIRQLEDALGLPLFDRTQRRPRLTADGRSYHEEIAGALRRIHGATRRLQARASARNRELSIAVHFGFAHLWLLPRLLLGMLLLRRTSKVAMKVLFPGCCSDRGLLRVFRLAQHIMNMGVIVC